MAYFRQRGNTWSFTVDIGRDPLTNRRKQKTLSGYPSEGAARVACEKYMQEIEQGKRPDHITLGQFIKEYHEVEVIHQVTEGTYTNHWQWARDYIIPRLGKMRVDRIKHGDIVKFYNGLARDGVSRALIKSIAMVLKKTLKAAVIWEYATKNPAAYAPPPSYEPRKMTVWTHEETSRFLEAAKEKWLYPFYVLAVYSGMRSGEMLALTWKDVDLKHRKIKVVKTLKYTKSKGLHIKGTKTKNSERVITVPQIVMDVLAAHKEKQLPGTAIVFDNIGEYIYTTDAWRELQKDCKSCEVPVIRVHDLRHTHATHLLQKYSVKVVAERLGDTAATVLNTYAHVLPNMQKEVAEYLDDLYQPVDN